jgi:methylglutaconyl-CoA hydratase
MKSFETLRIADAGPVARIDLARPEVHNAFDDRLIAELTEVLGCIERRPEIRVVLLAGEGRSFCAGADLNWMKRALAFGPEENRADARAMAGMFRKLDELPQAVVARVQGAAIGGGVGLVACSDVAIASDEARFGLAEVKLGIIPAVISPFVIRKIGEGNSREYFLTGARFDAAEARRIGLVSAVVAAGELDARIDATIRELLGSAPEAVAAAKRLIRAVSGAPLDEALDYAVEAIARRRTSPEGQEGMTAFLARRRPSWVAED